MAGLVEEARWRTSVRGRRYMMATLSDSSGQFTATAFEDDACAALEEAARKQSCALIAVELDRREGDETPRVSIKRLQPLDQLAQRSRLQMEVRLANSDLVPQIARELASARGGSGALRLRVPLADGGEALVIAGRDFILDAEIASRLERVAGEGNVELSVQEARLALVG
jgi:DNA polymerase-3 subunit alpha